MLALLTLLVSLCSTSMSWKACARASPVWDWTITRWTILISMQTGELTSGTSTISKTKANRWPSWCKWTVHATKARWFGEVQASVPMWICPGWSWTCITVISKVRVYRKWCQTYLKNFINSFATLLERNFNITRHCHRGWNRCTGAPCLHQMNKFTIFDNIHCPVTLSTPPGNVGPGWRWRVRKMMEKQKR